MHYIATVMNSSPLSSYSLQAITSKTSMISSESRSMSFKVIGGIYSLNHSFNIQTRANGHAEKKHVFLTVQQKNLIVQSCLESEKAHVALALNGTLQQTCHLSVYYF